MEKYCTLDKERKKNILTALRYIFSDLRYVEDKAEAQLCERIAFDINLLCEFNGIDKQQIEQYQEAINALKSVKDENGKQFFSDKFIIERIGHR